MSLRHTAGLLIFALALAACTPTPGTGKQGEPAQADGAGPTLAPAPAATASMPTLDLPTLDGTQFQLSAQRGKWVVVNFWATWCAPCLKEMPELSELHASGEGVQVIGLAYEDIDAAAMGDFLRARPVSYPIAIVDMYAPPADFATPRGLPMTYLIAPDGTVARSYLGPVTAAELRTAIAAAATGGPTQG